MTEYAIGQAPEPTVTDQKEWLENEIYQSLIRFMARKISERIPSQDRHIPRNQSLRDRWGRIQ